MGGRNRFTILNRDQFPNRHFVWANLADTSTGAAYYESIGYIPEAKRPDGPKCAIGRTVKDGEDIVCFGHVLMSISMEERERIEQFGIDGNTGQNLADAIEKRMFRGKHFRGMAQDPNFLPLGMEDAHAE